MAGSARRLGLASVDVTTLFLTWGVALISLFAIAAGWVRIAQEARPAFSSH